VNTASCNQPPPPASLSRPHLEVIHDRVVHHIGRSGKEAISAKGGAGLNRYSLVPPRHPPGRWWLHPPTDARGGETRHDQADLHGGGVEELSGEEGLGIVVEGRSGLTSVPVSRNEMKLS
jgi:hypothetical protein